MVFLIKKSVAKEILKSLGKNKLEELKREVIEILKKQDEKEYKKALSQFENEEKNMSYLEKSISGEWIEKAGYGIGTVRVWKGKKYKKIAPGKWARMYEKEGRGTNIAVGHLIAKVKKIDDIEELMNFVMQNKQRFQDENGMDLPILDKIRAEVDRQSGKIGSKGKSKQEYLRDLTKYTSLLKKELSLRKKLQRLMRHVRNGTGGDEDELQDKIDESLYKLKEILEEKKRFSYLQEESELRKKGALKVLSKEETKEFIKKHKNSKENERVSLGTISEDAKKRIKEATSLDVERVILDSDSVRHAFDPKHNLEENDLDDMKDVVETSTDISLSPNKNKTGNPIIIFKKQEPNGVILLEEYRAGKKELELQTAYRVKKNRQPLSVDKQPLANVQNVAAPNKTITDNDENVKQVNKDSEFRRKENTEKKEYEYYKHNLSEKDDLETILVDIKEEREYYNKHKDAKGAEKRLKELSAKEKVVNELLENTKKKEGNTENKEKIDSMSTLIQDNAEKINKFNIEIYKNEISNSIPKNFSKLDETQLNEFIDFLDYLEKQSAKIHEQTNNTDESNRSFLSTHHAKQLKTLAKRKLNVLNAEKEPIFFNEKIANSLNINDFREEFLEAVKSERRLIEGASEGDIDYSVGEVKFDKLVKENRIARNFIEKISTHKIEDIQSPLYKSVLMEELEVRGVFTKEKKSDAEKNQDNAESKFIDFLGYNLEGGMAGSLYDKIFEKYGDTSYSTLKKQVKGQKISEREKNIGYADEYANKEEEKSKKAKIKKSLEDILLLLNEDEDEEDYNDYSAENPSEFNSIKYKVANAFEECGY